MSIGKTSKKQVDNVRQLVFERDNHTCIVAGTIWETLTPCGGRLTIQHAVTRGMGGSAKWDKPEFLRSMCSVHNGLETSSAEFRKACERNGWSLPRWAAEQHPIGRVPVRYPDGWQLLGAGSRWPISENTAISLLEEIYGEEMP